VQPLPARIATSGTIAALAPEPIDKAGWRHGRFAGVSQDDAG
jgi:hypothetical protein